MEKKKERGRAGVRERVGKDKKNQRGTCIERGEEQRWKICRDGESVGNNERGRSTYRKIPSNPVSHHSSDAPLLLP